MRDFSAGDDSIKIELHRTPGKAATNLALHHDMISRLVNCERRDPELIFPNRLLDPIADGYMSAMFSAFVLHDGGFGEGGKSWLDHSGVGGLDIIRKRRWDLR